jgi:hypothetical protein
MKIHLLYYGKPFDERLNAIALADIVLMQELTGEQKRDIIKVYSQLIDVRIRNKSTLLLFCGLFCFVVCHVNNVFHFLCDFWS